MPAANLSNLLTSFEMLGRARSIKAQRDREKEIEKSKKTSSLYGTILGIGAGTAGLIIGGPTGGAAGLSLGSTLGRMVASTQGGEDVSPQEITGAAVTGAGLASQISTIASNKSLLESDYGIAQRELSNQVASGSITQDQANAKLTKLKSQADRGTLSQASYRNQIRAELGKGDSEIIQGDDGSIILQTTDIFTGDINQRAIRGASKTVNEPYNVAYMQGDDIKVKSFANVKSAQKFAGKSNGELFKPGGQPVMVRDLISQRQASKAAQKGNVRVDIATKIVNEGDKRLKADKEAASDVSPNTEEQRLEYQMKVAEEVTASGGVKNADEINAYIDKKKNELTSDKTSAALAVLNKPEYQSSPKAMLAKVGEMREALKNMKFIDKEAVEAQLAKAEIAAKAELQPKTVQREEGVGELLGNFAFPGASQ